MENNLSWKNLSATLAFSYIGRYNLYAEDKAFQQKDLPSFVWSPELSSNVVLRFPKLKAEAGLFYKYTGKLPSYNLVFDQSGQADVYLSRLDSYHWMDLTLSKIIARYLTLQGGVKNLFDVTRLNNAATTGSIHGSGPAILTAYGRSFFVGVNFQWSKSK